MASRAHQQNIVPVVNEALKRANITKEELSAVAFTRGPGLMGSLLVGVSFAKGFARSLNIPMLDVNHLNGHEVLLVLDGSTGQNAFEQAKQFTLATEVSSLAITKLDGTAKGGVVIGISDQFKIPVKYIGLGEGMEDLQVFRKKEFVDSLFGDN